MKDTRRGTVAAGATGARHAAAALSIAAGKLMKEMINPAEEERKERSE